MKKLSHKSGLLPTKKRRDSDAILSTKVDLFALKSALKNIKKPADAERLKVFFKSLQRFFLKKKLFERVFKASELWVEADHKLYKMINESSLTKSELAKELNTSQGCLRALRKDLKLAYDKPESVILSLKKKAFENKEYLTRKWFIRNGESSILNQDPTVWQ